MGVKARDGCYEVMLNYDCNARCRFCSQGGFDRRLNAPFRQVAENICLAWKSGYRKIGFTGGDPLVSAHIVKAAALARKVGFRYIRVQTNGIRLGDLAFCRRLAAAGLTLCKLSLHSDRAAEHDSLVRVPGAHARVMAGAAELRRLGIRLSNSVVINRLNYLRLPEITEFLLEAGITNIVFVYPVYTGAMAGAARGLGVSLPDCAPGLAGAAALMERAGLGDEALFLNVPPCFLGGRSSGAIGLEKFNTVVVDPAGGRTELDAVADAAKVRAPACRRCRLRGACAGVDARYARLFGFGGFRPAAARPRRAGPAPVAGGYLSDNERCLLEVLRRAGGPASTRRVLSLASGLALCRDCADGNSVLNAASRLVRRGVLERAFRGGEYFWRLKK